MLKKILSMLIVLEAIIVPIAGSRTEATVVMVNSQIGYKVDIDDSSVYMIGKNHANVIITPYYARWNPSYPAEVLWGKALLYIVSIVTVIGKAQNPVILV